MVLIIDAALSAGVIGLFALTVIIERRRTK